MAEIVDPRIIKLDLGAGQNPREGFECVDKFLPPYYLDLVSGRQWPWKDSSVDELHSSHFIEHIDKGNRYTTYTGQENLFYFFFEEAWRIAKPGALFTVVWPDLQSVRAFQDPTHCDFIPRDRLVYLDASWRKLNRLDHYSGKCDWECLSVTPTVPVQLTGRSQVVQHEILRKEWNVAIDNHAVLRCRK